MGGAAVEAPFSILEKEERGPGTPDPADGKVLGSAVLEILRGLFVGLLGFGFGISRGSERLDGLTKVHAAAGGHGGFQGIEAAGNVDILRDVSGGHTLANGLEAATSSGGIFAGEGFDFTSDSGVVAEDVSGRSVHGIGVRDGSGIAIGCASRSTVISSGGSRSGVSVGCAHRRTMTASGSRGPTAGMSSLSESGRCAHKGQGCQGN